MNLKNLSAAGILTTVAAAITWAANSPLAQQAVGSFVSTHPIFSVIGGLLVSLGLLLHPQPLKS